MEIKQRLNMYYNIDKKQVKLNFENYKEIYIRDKPLIFYDLIAYLCLHEFKHIIYPYFSKDFLNIFNVLQE